MFRRRLLAALVAPSLLAQSRDAGARVERVGDGVYAIIHDDATTEWPSGVTDWPHGNTGVVVGDDGVLVVDATYLPSRARADIALIRSITDKPVRYLVNTHWHFDHNNGNVAYRDAFPGVAIVSARENRRFIELNNTRYPRYATSPDSPKRATLRQLEALLASGRDSAGRPLSADARKSLEANVRRRRGELEELVSLRVVPPNLLFDRELTLFLGGRRVELRNWGRANSPDDVTVYLPDDRVLFAGDILVHPVPYAYSSYPVPWVDVLRGVEALPVVAVVPGHGPVLRDHGYTRRVRALLEAVAARVDSMSRRGMTVDQIRAGIDLEDLRATFVTGDDPTARELWESSIKKALVERTRACVVGLDGC